MSLISSLPGTALRTLVDIARLAQCFTLQTSDYDIIFNYCIDSASLAMSSWPDKGTCCEIDSVYQATCNNAVNMRGN